MSRESIQKPSSILSGSSYYSYNSTERYASPHNSSAPTRTNGNSTFTTTSLSSSSSSLLAGRTRSLSFQQNQVSQRRNSALEKYNNHTHNHARSQSLSSHVGHGATVLPPPSLKPEHMHTFKRSISTPSSTSTATTTATTATSKSTFATTATFNQNAISSSSSIPYSPSPLSSSPTGRSILLKKPMGNDNDKQDPINTSNHSTSSTIRFVNKELLTKRIKQIKQLQVENTQLKEQVKTHQGIEQKLTRQLKTQQLKYEDDIHVLKERYGLSNNDNRNDAASSTSSKNNTNKDIKGCFKGFCLKSNNRRRMPLLEIVDEIHNQQDEDDFVRNMTKEWIGPVGLTLFLPVNDGTNFDPLHTLPSTDVELDQQHDSSENESDEDEIAMDYDPDLESCPPILSHEQLHQIHTHGLPASVTLMTWTRAYSLQRDGDDFHSMLRKCANYQHTLIVIKTSNGDILGGYADTAWGKQLSLNARRSFYGSGRAFVFATNPQWSQEEEKELSQPQDYIRDYDDISSSDDDDETNPIHFYRWTGENDYSQICDIENGSLGMGGGGAGGEFGWIVENDFQYGSTGRCLTFGNPPLAKGNDGRFEVVGLDVYGFKSMSERLSSYGGNYSTSSIGSITSLTSMFEGDEKRQMCV